MIYKLDKTVVSVRGSAEKFLSGLTSNTLDRPRNAFLNMHGRIVATFDQVRAGDDIFLLVIASSAWEALKAHTDRYARLNNTTIEPVALNAYFDLSGDCPLSGGEYAIPQNSGRIILTARAIPLDVAADAFTVFRLQNNIPLHGVDYHDDFILNVHENDFVSYTKGCFLGQEPVSKVHNRSKPTWQLAVRCEDGLSEEEKAKMTSKARDPKTGRTLGFVFVKNAPAVVE
ncbi:MAG: hypothetical protein Q7K71_08015 [Candidatus Omnitrophota bacterium]|nr:hypothetical protein [Candidatus Omnitrophota bacterium]